MEKNGMWLRWAIILIGSAAVASSGCKPPPDKSNAKTSQNSGQKRSGKDSKSGKGAKGGNPKNGGKKSGGAKGSKKKSGEKKGKKAGTGAKRAGNSKAKGSGSKSAPSEPASGTMTPLEGISFAVPAEWKAAKAEKEVSALRGCYEIPGIEGNDAKAVVLIHHQPDIKGKTRESLEKLFAKMKPVEGADQKSPKVTDDTTPEGIKIIIGDMTGTLASRPNAEDSTPGPVRTIAAIIDDPAGPHTVRVSGPPAIMDKAADSILAFIRGVKLKS